LKDSKKLQWPLWGKFKNSLNCHNIGCLQNSRNFWFYDRGFLVGLINGDIYIYLRLTPIASCFHGNESLDKIGYNSVCIRDFGEIFALIGGFWGWAIECHQSHFPWSTPVAMATKFWTELAI